MSKVIVIGTVGAVLLYIIVGVWGYVTWVNYSPGGAEAALSDANILQAPYPNSCIPILIGNFALFFAIASAAPLVVLPAKDTCAGVSVCSAANTASGSKASSISYHSVSAGQVCVWGQCG